MSRQASGLGAWLVQRVSAIYVAGFSIFLAAYFAAGAPANFIEWHNFIGSPLMSVLTGLFFGSLLLHAWVGIRDIFIDYIKPTALKVTLLSLLALGLISCAIWVIRILLVVVV